MIISAKGEVLSGYVATEGVVYHDGDFYICVDYDEQSREYAKEREECYEALNDSDYKALKYMEGAISEEDYAPVKEQRQKYRDRINELEEMIVTPALTREQMDEAEKKALLNLGASSVTIMHADTDNQ